MFDEEDGCKSPDEVESEGCPKVVATLEGFPKVEVGCP